MGMFSLLKPLSNDLSTQFTFMYLYCSLMFWHVGIAGKLFEVDTRAWGYSKPNSFTAKCKGKTNELANFVIPSRIQWSEKGCVISM